MAKGAHVVPHLSELGPPSHAINGGIVAGLLLVSATLPAPVRWRLLDLVAQAVANRCIPRQELVISTCKGLACIRGEAPLELLAFWWFVAALVVDLVKNPPLYFHGPKFSNHPAHITLYFGYALCTHRLLCSHRLLYCLLALGIEPQTFGLWQKLTCHAA